MNETVLKDVGYYKDILLNPLLDSEDIRDLLVGDGYPDKLWEDIVHKQIFPYLYMDETQTEVKSYICYEVDIPRFASATIKDMKIIVWCVCHKSAMKCSKKNYRGTRADMLADAVERAFRRYENSCVENDDPVIGIGNLDLISVTNLTNINKVYYGRQLIFDVPDFKMKGV